MKMTQVSTYVSDEMWDMFLRECGRRDETVISLCTKILVEYLKTPITQVKTYEFIRPKRYPNIISFRLSEDILSQLRDRAKQEHGSVASVIRDAITAYFENQMKSSE